MFLLIGVFIWLMVLILAYFVPHCYILFATDSDKARLEVKEYINGIYHDFGNTPVVATGLLGGVSIIIILGWPIFLVVFGICAVVLFLAIIPYLLIRRLRKTIFETEKIGDNK